MEKIFERFVELMEENNVPKEKLMEVWNKHSFCMKILTAGPRKGLSCNKKCTKNTLYCRDHTTAGD